ncbi:hypothetical protein RIF29_29306 [Crotalaria pallida]|uniref:Uncharacterized protein n=1 Tax=Crotalaria pallida TaxID=3830 RepID=A0AAN9I092_CROPI
MMIPRREALTADPMRFHLPWDLLWRLPTAEGKEALVMKAPGIYISEDKLTNFGTLKFLYNDIAKYGYAAMGRSMITAEKGSSQNDSTTVQNEQHQVKRPSGLGGVMIGIGEQVYSILLLSVFFLEVCATGFIPYIGNVLNFVLLSWMYAYYCFEFSANFYYKLV